HFDRDAQRTTHIVTLKFGPSDDPAYTIDYRFMYPSMRMSRPSVVDEVITRGLAGSAHTRFTTNLDGEWIPTPFPLRLTNRTTFTRSLPVDYFSRLAQSPSVRERIFDAELVFSDLQLRMLKQRTVDQW